MLSGKCKDFGAPLAASALIFWRHIHTPYLFQMFAEEIHVKDIEQSNFQEKNQSWVMLSNGGGYIHNKLANTQGEHLFPKLPLLYHAMRCCKLYFMPMFFMVLISLCSINNFVLLRVMVHGKKIYMYYFAEFWMINGW